MTSYEKLVSEIGKTDADEEVKRLKAQREANCDVDPDPDSIDSLIATRVMDWKYIDRKRVGWGYGPKVWSTHDFYSPTFHGFSPSIKLSHAWMLVEELNCYYFVLWRDASGWTARFHDGDVTEESTGDSPQTAICLAALKVCEGVKQRLCPSPA